MYYIVYQPTMLQFYPYPSMFYNPFLPTRQYPEVDPTTLSESVDEFQVLMQQGELLLNRLSDTTFSKQLMEAAQKGNQAEVDRLIHTIDGLYVPVQINYSPSGAIFNLQSPAVSKGAECCTLHMTLKWGK